MKRAINALASIDNLAPQLSLTYKRESKMKTPLGGGMVLAIYTVISLGFFYFSRDIIYRTNPITKVNKTFRDEILMPAENFPLFFMISDRFVNPLQPGDPLSESIEIVVEYWITVIDDNGKNLTKFNTYKTMPCTKEYFEKYEDFFSITVSPASACVDYSKSYDYFGNEAEDQSIYAEYAASGTNNHVNVKVKACDEKKKPGCRKAFLEAGQLLMFMGYPTAVVNFDDFDEPVTHSLDFFQSSISPGLFLRKYASLSVNEFVSDNGLILTDTHSETYVQTKIDDSDVMNFSENSRSLMAFTFKLDLIKETMERRYVKIQEILANVGGFTKAILLFATFVVKYFSEYSFFNSFGREINTFSSGSNKPQLVNNLVKDNKSESKEQISPIAVNSAIRADIGFFAFLGGIFFKKNSVAAKEREKVFKHLDIAFITRRLTEIEDKLKVIRR